jgi:hypothetical protein
MWAIISGLAAVVAVAITYFQWRTAQTKVALEIHAARYAIYQDLRKAVSDFLRDLNFSLEVQGKYMDAQSRARFHFGAEVAQYLESLRRDMIKGHRCAASLAAVISAPASDVAEARSNAASAAAARAAWRCWRRCAGPRHG